MMDIEHSTVVTRICTKCDTAKPATLEYFRAEKRTKVGLQSKCFDCERTEKRGRRKADPGMDSRYYEANKERLLSRQKVYCKKRRAENGDELRRNEAEYRKKNIEKVRGYQNRWYKRNRESEIARLTKYYKDNPDKKAAHAANSEAWRKANRDKSRSYVRNRRARIKQSEGQHTAEDIKRLIAGQKGHCWWCSKKIPDDKHHVDHRIPIAKGGGNGVENLVISCARCNHKKSSKMPWEMEVPRLF